VSPPAGRHGLALYRGTAVSVPLMGGLTISRFAAAGGVGVETVRFYERRGLLPRPGPSGSGFREYTEEDQRRLAFIRRARELGFSLAEISDLLGPAQARSADEIGAAAARKLADLAARIRELRDQQCRLRRLTQVCEHGSAEDCAALNLGEPR
jgi:MerR family transcriptional regulator, mercuric resistance operon regulatory protein